jgi:hypothetical protein
VQRASRWPWSIEDAVLYALVARAWERRGSPDFGEAVAAIIDAQDRAPLTWFEKCERRHVRNLHLIQLLRETDPSLPSENQLTLVPPDGLAA